MIEANKSHQIIIRVAGALLGMFLAWLGGYMSAYCLIVLPNRHLPEEQFLMNTFDAGLGAGILTYFVLIPLGAVIGLVIANRYCQAVERMMLRHYFPKLMSAILLGLLIGVAIGAIRGQWQLQQAWEEVNRNPSSFPGGPGSYLCIMGYAPILSGIAGGMLGGVAGLCGGFCWLKFQKDTLTA